MVGSPPYNYTGWEQTSPNKNQGYSNLLFLQSVYLWPVWPGTLTTINIPSRLSNSAPRTSDKRLRILFPRGKISFINCLPHPGTHSTTPQHGVLPHVWETFLLCHYQPPVTFVPIPSNSFWNKSVQISCFHVVCSEAENHCVLTQLQCVAPSVCPSFDERKELQIWNSLIPKTSPFLLSVIWE